jgi:hypothetical protein
MRRFGWVETTPDPRCSEAVFCAVRGQSASDKTTMLERIGGELVSATEALAQEERDFRPADRSTLRVYFNVIVTTAELKIAKFTPGRISLSNGTFADAQVEDIPFVRFRKQLSTRHEAFGTKDLADGTMPGDVKENTVFVVKATELVSFLGDFELSDESFRALAHSG